MWTRVGVGLLFVCFLGAGPARAGDLDTLIEVRGFTDQAMEKIGTGDLESAFKMMRRVTNIDRDKFDEISNKAIQMQPAVTREAGKVTGSEFVLAERLGTSLQRVVYLQKREKLPVVWYFYFYRTDEAGWRLIALIFSDQSYLLFR